MHRNLILYAALALWQESKAVIVHASTGVGFEFGPQHYESAIHLVNRPEYLLFEGASDASGCEEHTLTARAPLAEEGPLDMNFILHETFNNPAGNMEYYINHLDRLNRRECLY